MKDLAYQAYVQYLQQLIEQYEQTSTLKDKLIAVLEQDVADKADLIESLQESINELLEMITEDQAPETKALGDR